MLRLLALGVPYSSVTERLAETFKRPFSRDDLQKALIHAARLTKDADLAPPARSAFLKRQLALPAKPAERGDDAGVSPSPALDELRSLASEILDSYVASSDVSDPLDPRVAARHSAALQYAEAVVDQHETLCALEHAASDVSTLHSQLGARDRGRLSDLLLWWGGRRTLDVVIDRWEGSIRKLERGSSALVHETFTNSLVNRDAVETALTVIEPAGKGATEGKVRALDERYVAVTRPVSSSIAPPDPWAPQAWWWYRLPRDLNDDFLERLQHVAGGVARELQ